MSIGRVKPVNGLNLREKPNGQKIAVLRHNQEVELLEQVSFYRVRNSDGTVGYVHGDYIEESPKEESIILTDSIESEFPSQGFDMVTYHGTNFVGKEAVVDADFVAPLNRLNKFAIECNVNVWITSSTRNINEQVKGAIVPPATKSCHHVGHAIDMNIQFEGRLYNSKKLIKSNLSSLPGAIVKFIGLIREDDELRWGGDFSRQDPVHIDDNLFRRQEIIYRAKLNSRLDQLNA